MRDGVMREIAGNIKASPNTAVGEVAVAVFNPLGFARTGLAVLRPPADMAGLTFNSVRIGSESRPVQRSAEGDWLFAADVGSLGYATAYLSTASAPPPSQPARIESAGRQYIIQNGFLTAGINSGSGYLDYVDEATPGRETNVLDISNQIAFYIDDGQNYQYGGETGGDGMPLASATVDTAATHMQILEDGPLRVRLKFTTVHVVSDADGGARVTYVREYALEAGEPMLRLRTTGACPFGYSAMVSFNTREGMTTLAHGTTYHWDDVPAVPYVLGPSMQPTHDFVIPEGANGKPLFAVYHGSMPAWGQVLAKSGGSVQPSRTLLGGLSRNPSGDYFGWFGGTPTLTPPSNGIDPDSHTFDYAIRMPSGISCNRGGAADPSTGLQLRESLGYTTPLLAFPVPAATSAALPPSFSLASVSAPGPSQPVIMAAKPAESDPNDLVLRVYQPSNAAMDVKLSLAGLNSQNGGSAMTVTPVTALEQPLPGVGPLTPTGTDYPFSAPLALTTLRVTPAQ